MRYDHDPLGRDMVDAVNLAIAHAGGGIAGRGIDLIVEDDGDQVGSIPAFATISFQRAISAARWAASTSGAEPITSPLIA